MPAEPEFHTTPDCPSECYDMEKHVAGCPHGPEPPERDYDDGEAADMKYRQDMKDAGRGHLLR